MNITATKPNSHHLAPAVTMVVGLLLLLLAIVPLAARLSLLATDDTHNDLHEQQNISTTALQDFIKNRERVLPYFTTRGLLDDMALAHFAAAQKIGLDQPEAAAELMAALHWQQRALVQSAADTYGWSRLTYLLQLCDAPKAQIASALLQSYRTAPYEPRLLLPRLNMAVALLDQIDPLIKAQLPEQIRQIWKLQPWDLAKAAKANYYTTLVEEALIDDAEGLARFRGAINEK